MDKRNDPLMTSTWRDQADIRSTCQGAIKVLVDLKSSPTTVSQTFFNRLVQTNHRRVVAFGILKTPGVPPPQTNHSHLINTGTIQVGETRLSNSKKTFGQVRKPRTPGSTKKLSARGGQHITTNVLHF